MCSAREVKEKKAQNSFYRLATGWSRLLSAPGRQEWSHFLKGFEITETTECLWLLGEDANRSPKAVKVGPAKVKYLSTIVKR